jgi:hypothetical protein
MAATSDPLESACLAAERAALQARLGRFDEAGVAIAQLRAAHEPSHSAALAVRLCLAEGLVEHYRNQSPLARDRIRRAYALAVGARLRPMIALSAAWFAHMDWVHDDLPALARHVAEALQEAAPDHHAVRACASLVAAQLYHWGGRLDLAQPWYQRTHEHATAEGDEATLGALLKNRAWIAGTAVRLVSILAPAEADPAELRHAQLGAESSAHFYAHLGEGSLCSFGPLMHAQLLVVQGCHAEALTLLAAQVPKLPLDGSDYLLPAVHADIAWCHVQLGHAEQALASAQLAENSVVDGCDAQDRAGAHGRLAQVFRALAMQAPANAHAEQAAAQLKTLREQQARSIDLLDASLKQVPGAPASLLR